MRAPNPGLLRLPDRNRAGDGILCPRAPGRDNPRSSVARLPRVDVSLAGLESTALALHGSLVENFTNVHTAPTRSSTSYNMGYENQKCTQIALLGRDFLRILMNHIIFKKLLVMIGGNVLWTLSTMHFREIICGISFLGSRERTS
jgi:hypothetical protein